jgi:serine/threonine protein phosphatase PrpC
MFMIRFSLKKMNWTKTLTRFYRLFCRQLDIFLQSYNGKQQLLITTANGGKQTFPVDLKVSNYDVSASFSKRSRTLTVKVGLQPDTTTSNTPTLPLPISTSSKPDQYNATTSTAPIPSTPRQSADSELELSHSPESLKDHHPYDNNPEAAGDKKKKKKKKKKSKASTKEGEETSIDHLSLQKEEPQEQEQTAAPPSPKEIQRPKQDDKPLPLHHLDPTSPVSQVLNALKGTTILGGGEVSGEHSPSSLTNGPITKDAIAKDRCRDRSKGGEDQWLMKPHNTWKLRVSNSGDEEEREGEEDNGGSFVSTSFSAFGVFDGHGGKQVATFASNMVLKNTMAIMDSGSTAHVSDLHNLHTTDLLSAETGIVGVVDVGVWQAQAAFVDRLPQALVQAFIQTDKESHRRFNRGGTTATVAVLCGWELVVANVGDSLAYLDTGTEVLCICGNHRLADSPAEVKRIEDSGGEVASSTVDGKPAGPIRVWPGGLAMARSIGDFDAGDRVLGKPDVRQVTIPSGGARLIIASDGLWDAVKPKNAAHHTRDMGASEAAHKLLAQAIKKDHLKDDVTVVVVDILPSEHDKLVPNLVAGSSSSSSSHGSLSANTKNSTTTTRLAVVRNPLQEDIDFVSAGGHRRSEVLAALEAAQLERREAEARAEERRREKEEGEEGKAAKGHQHGTTATGGNSDGGLYAELSNLKLTPEDVQSATWKITNENKNNGGGGGANKKSPSKQQQQKNKRKPPPKRKEAVVNENAENQGHDAAPSSSHDPDLNEGGDDKHMHGRSGRGGGRGRGGRGRRGGGNAMHADKPQPPSVEGVSKSSNTTTFIRKRGGGGREEPLQQGTATNTANIKQQQA